MLNYILSEWSKIPFYFNRNTLGIFSSANIRYIVELRNTNSLLSQLVFSKLTLLINTLFNALTFLSPSLYFSSLLGLVTFPFWLIGIYRLISKSKFKIFLLLTALSVFAYMIGEKNIAFTFPIALIYIYFIYVGVISFRKK